MTNRWIWAAMAAFVAAMSVAAALFWGAAALTGGARSVIAGLDITFMVLFSMAHLPAMAASILLWRAGAVRTRPYLRWCLFLAMMYFSTACAVAFFGNFLAASILNLMG
ncbi:hypothetical protein V8J82_05760 [Gymnodinialimonas sp. 2305UL16-5]|uniref:hypothetical protein n=1 Tax=Gymnodinialimonas mytili TaxID=3126503 RepID=UPI0030AE9E27